MEASRSGERTTRVSSLLFLFVFLLCRWTFEVCNLFVFFNARHLRAGERSRKR